MRPIAAPILGITGVNGAGKTLLAVELAILAMRQGQRVVSTVPIDTGEYRSEPLLSLSHLLDLEDCAVLLDEIAVIFSSRGGGAVPSEVVTFLQTLRHRRVTVTWTAPNWSRADVLVRSVTQACATVRPMISRRVDGSLWPRPVLAAIGVLDTVSVPTDNMPDRVLQRRLWRPKKSPAWGSYDTHAPTPQIGGLLQGGPCPDCGGMRARPKCEAKTHELLGLPAPLDPIATAQNAVQLRALDQSE